MPRATKAKLEKDFEQDLCKELEATFPGCVILKNDPNYIQGFPDRLILFKNKWAAFETKRETKSARQVNQEYYVSKLDDMSYSRFVSPENKDEFVDELQSTFGTRRKARAPKRQ